MLVTQAAEEENETHRNQQQIDAEHAEQIRKTI